jgi:transcriptional regulator with XRE-family HTH domain
MADRPLPKVTLARNLRLLVKASGRTSPEIARDAGVDAKTMNNMLHGRYDPRPEKVDQVAKVFGLTGWQLLIPNLPGDMVANGRLERVIADYVAADPDGRESIARIADLAAHTSRHKS